MLVAVLFPTRGLLRSRTLEAVYREVREYPHELLFSHNRPIPDCCTWLTRRGLDSGATHLWFVEEDVIPRPGTLARMLSCPSEVVGVGYPLRKDGKTLCGGVVLDFTWVGLGCTLVHRGVFDRIEDPWFKTDVRCKLVHSGSAGAWRVTLQEEDRPYGGHDIYFSWQVYKAGISMAWLKEDPAEHRPVSLQSL